MNGILMPFVLFVCSWRFTFYIISFITGLAVLYDVSTYAVTCCSTQPTPARMAECVVKHAFSDLLLEVFHTGWCVSSA